MKKIMLLAALAAPFTIFAQHAYKVAQTFSIPSPGGWDYLAVNGGRLYVSHGTQVNILNAATGDSAGVIPNTEGVHGIAFDQQLQRGYTSNGRSNDVTVFDLKDNHVITRISTGENPDAIIYEPYLEQIITCNGRGKSISLIDPKTNAVVSTIDVGGRPETAVTDENGHLFVNIEDKNEIAVVDLGEHMVTARWPLDGGEGPTGLAYDKNTKRLFSGCDNKLLVVMDATNGKVISKLPIGEGCDGVCFDAKNNVILTSNGEGTITAVHENSADSFTVLGNYPTKRGARTIAIDPQTSTIYLPTAEFEPGNGSRPRPIAGTFQILVVR